MLKLNCIGKGSEKVNLFRKSTFLLINFMLIKKAIQNNINLCKKQLFFKYPSIIIYDQWSIWEISIG